MMGHGIRSRMLRLLLCSCWKHVSRLYRTLAFAIDDSMNLCLMADRIRHPRISGMRRQDAVVIAAAARRRGAVIDQQDP